MHNQYPIELNYDNYEKKARVVVLAHKRLDSLAYILAKYYQKILKGLGFMEHTNNCLQNSINGKFKQIRV